MMYAELYQYLILHKKLPVPGIGTFLLERKPAEADFLNRQIKAPVYSIAFGNEALSPSMKFFNWLGAALGISDRDAVIRFNDFAFDLKKQIAEGAIINWNSVGTLSKGLSGEVKFAATILQSTAAPVTAEKVIREKSEHFVRVGEEEKTSAEMTEMLSRTTTVKSYWWVYALVPGVLALGFIGWHFYQNGFDVSSVANGCPLTPMEAPLP